MLLTDLKVGEIAKIINVGCENSLKKRLLVLGVLSGEIIELVRYAPFGGPVEITIKGYNLAIRKNQAKKITVKKYE